MLPTIVFFLALCFSFLLLFATIFIIIEFVCLEKKEDYVDIFNEYRKSIPYLALSTFIAWSYLFYLLH